MDVSAALFPFEVVSIIKHIVNSHFVAIDVELSGIPVRSNQLQEDLKGRKARTGRPSLQEVYAEAREAAKKYQILQIGLTVVEESGNGMVHNAETLPSMSYMSENDHEVIHVLSSTEIRHLLPT